MTSHVALVLAGGAARRMQGRDKASLVVRGRTLLNRVLDATAGFEDVVVVGPVRPTDASVTFVTEDPPGGGPAAAVAAGLNAVPALGDDALIVLLAVDLPGVTAASIDRLLTAANHPVVDGAVMIDSAGREQLLVSVWRRGPLAAAVARRTSWAGASLRSLLEPLRRGAVAAFADEATDVDTVQDWQAWQRRSDQPRD